MLKLKMYFLLVICACWWTSAIGEPAPYYELDRAAEYFEDYILQYDKHYSDEQEKKARFQIFKENLEDANRLNEESNLRSFGPVAVFGITFFMDLTQEEFEYMYTGFGPHNLTFQQSACRILTDNDIGGLDPPESFDWRQQNVVTGVKNQGQCQSCYAFSTVGLLESQTAIKYRQLVQLSEQEIVDCDQRSNGCNTGLMANALTSLMELGGIVSEADYPYRAVQGYCRFDRSRVAVKVRGCFTYQLRSQEKLKQLLYNTGPVSIAIKASNLRKYNGGVFADQYCSWGRINHAVLLVGYGTDPRQGPYWIIKNSYGDTFGEAGYIRVQRGEQAESCGLMNEYMATAVIV